MHSYRVVVEESLAHQFRQHAKSKGFEMPENLLRHLLATEMKIPPLKMVLPEKTRLAPSQMTVCKFLEAANDGRLTVRELIRMAGLSVSSIHNAVYRLADLGYIQSVGSKQSGNGPGAPSKLYALTGLGTSVYHFHRDADAIQNRLNIYETEKLAEADHANMARLHGLDDIAEHEMAEVSAVRAKFRNIRVDSENFRGRTEGRLLELAEFNHGKDAAPALSEQWIAQAKYEVLSGQTTYEALYKGATERLNDALWEVEEPRRFAEMQRGADASHQAELAYQADLVEQEARAEHSARAEAEQP